MIREPFRSPIIQTRRNGLFPTPSQFVNALCSACELIEALLWLPFRGPAPELSSTGILTSGGWHIRYWIRLHYVARLGIGFRKADKAEEVAELNPLCVRAPQAPFSHSASRTRKIDGQRRSSG